VADVVADPLWVHHRWHAAERWRAKRGEYVSVELGFFVSHQKTHSGGECHGAVARPPASDD
jgi:hypothetical protein